MEKPGMPAPEGEKKGFLSKVGDFFAHKPEEQGPTRLERANGEGAGTTLETARVIDRSSQAVSEAERKVDLAQAYPETPVTTASIAEARARVEAAAQASPEQPAVEQRDAA